MVEWQSARPIAREVGAMKRVIILLSHQLLGQGIQSLLLQQTGLEIVACEPDVDKLIELAKDLKPDVAIVDLADLAWDRMPVVLRILGTGVVPTVIGVGVEDNTISIYHEEQRVVKEVTDLVKAIQQGAAG
jgi:chemotaxis response regulator CheB